MTTCVDLRELSGGRYKVTYDPAYNPRGVPRDQRDPWMLQIPCRDGCVIFPHGGTTLAVECGRRRRLVLRRLGLRVHQDGDDGATFLFDAADFDRVAAIVHPHRRRKGRPLTEADREELRRWLAVARAARARSHQR
jgi:hypothetical protein